VPLGEGARRYYEQQFGDRIRKVSKGGGSSGGGSNWNGRAGCGIAIGVIVLLRIIVAFSRIGSSTPSYTYTPPPQPRFDPDWQKKLDERLAEDNQEKRFNDMLQQIIEAQPAERPQPAQPQDLAALEKNGLRNEEVPLPQGLCYRIHHESRRAMPTPGSRICQLLDEDARQLIAKAAEGKALDKDEKEELLEALNDLLGRPDLYEAAAFGRIEPARRGPLPVARYNRQLLEKCYPQQIVPLSERGKLDAAAHLQWLDRASADLTAARQEYEPAKR